MSGVETIHRPSDLVPSRRDHALTYRPHLDGLRTVAVYLVVAFHAGISHFSGGFVGVDIFFVLSGFLVTRILVRSLGNIGRIDWRTFYSRRVRRILPAALVTLIVSGLVYAAVASPLEILDVAGGFRAASLYFANWYFIHQATDYFAANVNHNPVLHFWSLAVEEQFYVLWPLVLGALYVLTGRFGRRRWWVLRIAVILLGIASAVEALHIGSSSLERAYYGTDTRAYQLLAGAAIALTPQLLRLGTRSRAIAQRAAAASIIGLLLLATSAINLSPITRGVVTAALASILIVALENARHGPVRQVLSSKPFTYLGRISYGTYLWQGPVIVLLVRGRKPAPVALFLATVVIATLLAALSFWVLEHPIRSARKLDRYRTPAIVIGLSASLVAGVFVLPSILDSGPGSVIAVGGPVTSKSGVLDWQAARRDIPRAPDCVTSVLRKCVLVKGTKEKVLVVGDSHALMWMPAFRQIAKNESWTLAEAAIPTCAWQPGLLFTFLIPKEPYCARHQAAWYQRTIPRFNPDLVILVERSYDDPRQSFPVRFSDGHKSRLGYADFEQDLVSVSTATIRKLHDQGRQVAIFEPIPDTWPFFPLQCISEGTPPSHCTYKAYTKLTPLVRSYRNDAAQMSDTWSVDLDRVVCPRFPICDTVEDHEIVYRDDGHITATFARSQAGAMQEIFRTKGILSDKTRAPRPTPRRPRTGGVPKH